MNLVTKMHVVDVEIFLMIYAYRIICVQKVYNKVSNVRFIFCRIKESTLRQRNLFTLFA